MICGLILLEGSYSFWLHLFSSRTQKLSLVSQLEYCSLNGKFLVAFTLCKSLIFINSKLLFNKLKILLFSNILLFFERKILGVFFELVPKMIYKFLSNLKRPSLYVNRLNSILDYYLTNLKLYVHL